MKLKIAAIVDCEISHLQLLSPAGYFGAELFAVGCAGSAATTVAHRTDSCSPWTAPVAGRVDLTQKGCSLRDQLAGRISPGAQKRILVVLGESL